MATQKELLAHLRDFAADLGAIVTIRKNGHGEYDTRIRMNGTREYVLTYFASDWLDAEETVLFTLNRIRDEQRAEGRRRERAYEADLEAALSNLQGLFRAVDCEIRRHGDYVNMWSPKTGSHTLTMRLGVRPVSDLYAHACGFVEQQTHVKV